MNSPDDIDALAVARRVLASPKTFRLSTHDELAMAGCLIGLDEQVSVLEARPTTNARLAAAIAGFIKAHEHDAEMRRNWAEESGLNKLEAAMAVEGAFNTLKTTFETEFPNV